MKAILLTFCVCAVFMVSAQVLPNVWVVNVDDATGYNGYVTNVQAVYTDANFCYIETNNIASWIEDGFDWPNNPWFPEVMNYTFKFPFVPVMNNGTLVGTPYGHIGVWTNGVSIYNPKDAHSWLENEVWFQNAFYFEHLMIETMDPCLGHPNASHEYHLHVNPTCLYDDTDSSQHAPIVGYAFDGYPIYGAYGYENTDGTGGIVRMTTSYQLRNITERTVLPDGTVLAANDHGPTLEQYPLGAYVEDFEYVAGSGNLDAFNGRFSVTPEYPEGTYCYFATLDHNLNPAYPYVLGPHFRGMPLMMNMGPNSGNLEIPADAQPYLSATEIAVTSEWLVFPNPTSDSVTWNTDQQGDWTVVSMDGKVCAQGVGYTADISALESGVYILQLTNRLGQSTKRIIKE
jgi:hypothetical protein